LQPIPNLLPPAALLLAACGSHRPPAPAIVHETRCGPRPVELVVLRDRAHGLEAAMARSEGASVSPDGATLTANYTYTDASGRQATALAVFDRMK
jgi:hypothetical protein